MNKTYRRILYAILITFSMVFTASAVTSQDRRIVTTVNLGEDLNPLVDNITVTVEIQKIRYLEPLGVQRHILKQIDYLTDPDFFVKVIINAVEFTSPIWNYTRYITNPNWSATQIVPKDQDFVSVNIQLWDWNSGKPKLMDISGNLEKDYPYSYQANLTYSVKAGCWWGDDSSQEESAQVEPSGYGRLNGCDDGNINLLGGRDCELWFTISQNDYDNDSIPYWTEVNIFHTDPTVDNRGEDADLDGVSIEWEHKWGCRRSGHGGNYSWVYDPFKWENHSSLDPDNDGLNNIEEYRTSQWGSDPFRKDIFLELDQMEKGPNGEGAYVPDLAKELMADSFDKHNIVLHVDDGCMGGGEFIPFNSSTDDEALDALYFDYFIHGDPNNWRRGVFHYGLIIYHSTGAVGFGFGSNVDGKHLFDSFAISTEYHETTPLANPLIGSLLRKSFNKEYQRAVVYAGVFLHETGHVLQIYNPAVDNPLSIFPNKDWWKFHNYRSCMNYQYTYLIPEYSDGMHGKNDFDDWDKIDLTAFQTEHHWP